MRNVKTAGERRNEILDVAGRLFAAKGFEHTSLTDIQNETGVARGTLYYYFKSKEEILDGIISRITARLVDRADALARQKEIPVLQRLALIMGALQVKDDPGRGIMKQMHKQENIRMHQKMLQELSAGLIPLLAGLVEEGNALGICRTKYPLEVVEMTLLYASMAFDDSAGHSGKEQKAAAFIYNLERMLGMEEGSMRAVERLLCADAGQNIRQSDESAGKELS